MRDQAAFARCIGTTPRALAERDGGARSRDVGPVGYFSPERDVAGRYAPPLETDDADVRRYAEGWRRIWGVKETAAIRDSISMALPCHPGRRARLNGHGAIDRFCLGYLASFPDGVFKVESAFANRDPGQPVRMTMRWSLTGHPRGLRPFRCANRRASLRHGYEPCLHGRRSRDARMDRHRRGRDLEADPRAHPRSRTVNQKVKDREKRYVEVTHHAPTGVGHGVGYRACGSADTVVGRRRQAEAGQALRRADREDPLRGRDAVQSA